MDIKAFFDEFPPVGKSEWLAAVEKSLKGKKTLEELVWQPEEGLSVSPWVHPDDFEAALPPMTHNPLAWEIAEAFDVDEDTKGANIQMRHALSFGTEGLALRFMIDPLTSDRLTEALDGVFLDHIGLHLSDASGNPTPPAAALYALGALAKSHQIPAGALHGTFDYNPAALQLIADWRYTAELVQMAEAEFPGFRVLHADGLGLTHLGAVDQLAELLRIGNQYLTKLKERGVEPGQTAAQLHFSIAAGDSYFLEMAKLRAFRQLWLNVQQGWDAPLQFPHIRVFFNAETYTDDLYTNMIRATTMAMSAVLGGADALTVLPYDHGREGLTEYAHDFGRRIARNVQHLLKMESRLEEVVDPVAGSYYLDRLTGVLAERAWERFRMLNVG